MIKRTAYKCEHGRCKKLLLTKSLMKKHEETCIFNPKDKEMSFPCSCGGEIALDEENDRWECDMCDWSCEN